MVELVNRIEQEMKRLQVELEALDKMLELAGRLVPKEVPPVSGARGFLSDEARRKISEAQKRIWAARKATQGGQRKSA